MTTPLLSLELALEKAFDKGLVEEEIFTTAIGRIEMLKVSLENRDREALITSIRAAFQTLGLPYEKLREDVQLLKRYCSEMSHTFENFFYNAETTMTTVNQSA